MPQHRIIVPPGAYPEPVGQSPTARPESYENLCAKVQANFTELYESIGLLAPPPGTVPSSASSGYTTWVNQGADTEIDLPQGMSFVFPSNQGVYSPTGLIKPVPHAAEYTVTLLFDWSGPLLYNNTYALIGWYDGVGAIDALAINPYNGFLSYGRNLYANPLSPASIPGPVPLFTEGSELWLQLANNGTSIVVSASNDGVNYSTLYSFLLANGYLLNGYNYLFIGADAYLAQAAYTISSYSD